MLQSKQLSSHGAVVKRHMNIKIVWHFMEEQMHRQE